MLSALWMYPESAYTAERGHKPGCVFMYHIVPRARYLSYELVEAEYGRLSRAIIRELADRRSDHWPQLDEPR